MGDFDCCAPRKGASVIVVPVKGLLPTHAHLGDAGGDLQALTEGVIPSGGTQVFRTGTQIAIPPGHFGLLAGRSGLGTKHGVTLANSVGIIDAGFRGEIQVGLTNHGRKPYTVGAGERIAQLIIVPFARIQYLPVTELDRTSRGENGFGSTGRAT